MVLLGEVGGTMELEAAEYIKHHMTKPVVALIVGRSAPEGAQMGHAGAIIEGKEGTATNKIKTLEEAGVTDRLPSGRNSADYQDTRSVVMKKYIVNIDELVCKGCGLCIYYCPKGCIKTGRYDESEGIQRR